MTFRFPIQCDTCFQGITLRIGMGTQIEQHLAINCPKCQQKISIIITLNKENVPYKPKFTINENAHEVSEKSDFIILNIHTELVYPEEDIHTDILLPATLIGMKLLKHAKKEGIYDFENDSNKLTSNISIAGKTIATGSVFDALGGDSELLEDWKHIYKAYSLLENKMVELANKELKNYSRINEVYGFSSLFNSIFFDFLNRLVFPNTVIYHQIKKVMSKIKKKQVRYKEFKEYYQDELYSLYMKNYIDIFQEYFKNFSEYNRLLLNVKINLHPGEIGKSIFCPVNFDDVKMFYGNAYEYLTTHLTVFVCVNNLSNNRSYNIFEKLTFPKYLQLNKDSRCGPLQNNLILNKICDNLDSSLRNASHHKWFYIDKNKPGYLQYRSGGSGALHEISYLDYIYKSNQLILKLAQMAMLELKFLVPK